MNPVKFYITKSASDWFEDVPYELNPRAYSFYKLEALGSDMVWTLKCYNRHDLQEQLMETFTLSPGTNIATLVAKLNVVEIKGNANCSIRELLK